MTYLSKINAGVAQRAKPAADASASTEPRPSTPGQVRAAMDRMKEAPRERFARSLSERSTSTTVYEALYQMKGKRYVQDQNQDDRTLDILSYIPLAYQIDMIVQRFLQSGNSYPTPDIMDDIIADLEDEGVFTDVDTFR